MYRPTPQPTDPRHLHRQIQHMSYQIRQQNLQVQQLLGSVAIWEATVLRPLASRLHS